ncbi:MAG: hypothetical protein H7831_11810 [Magnetococcus sp. WYHC-3]
MDIPLPSGRPATTRPALGLMPSPAFDGPDSSANPEAGHPPPARMGEGERWHGGPVLVIGHYNRPDTALHGSKIVAI